jgi:hypothetical protein
MAKELPVYEILLQDDETFAYDKISIVDKPAIMKDFYAFAQQSLPYKFEADNEKQILAGPFMIPDLPIYRVDETGKEFFVKFSKDVVRQLHYNFSKSNSNHAINIMHGSEMAEAFVIESWIIEDEKFDKSRKYGFKLPVGTSFGLVKIESKEFWDSQIKTGNLRGFSIEAMLSIGTESVGTIKMQKFMDYTLKDGTKIRVPEDIAQGSTIMVIADDGSETAAPDGEHILDDGRVVIVKDGIISEVKEVSGDMADEPVDPAADPAKPAEPSNAPAMSPDIEKYVIEQIALDRSALKTEVTQALAAMMEKIAALEAGKAEVEKIKEENATMSAQMKKFSEIPGIKSMFERHDKEEKHNADPNRKMSVGERLERERELLKKVKND